MGSLYAPIVQAILSVRLVSLRETVYKKILNIYSTGLAKTAPYVSELQLRINFAEPALRVLRD